MVTVVYSVFSMLFNCGSDAIPIHSPLCDKCFLFNMIYSKGREKESCSSLSLAHLVNRSLWSPIVSSIFLFRW